MKGHSLFKDTESHDNCSAQNKFARRCDEMGSQNEQNCKPLNLFQGTNNHINMPSPLVTVEES